MIEQKLLARDKLLNFNNLCNDMMTTTKQSVNIWLTALQCPFQCASSGGSWVEKLTEI